MSENQNDHREDQHGRRDVANERAAHFKEREVARQLDAIARDLELRTRQIAASPALLVWREQTEHVVSEAAAIAREGADPETIARAAANRALDAALGGSMSCFIRRPRQALRDTDSLADNRDWGDMADDAHFCLGIAATAAQMEAIRVVLSGLDGVDAEVADVCRRLRDRENRHPRPHLLAAEERLDVFLEGPRPMWRAFVTGDEETWPQRCEDACEYPDPYLHAMEAIDLWEGLVGVMVAEAQATAWARHGTWDPAGVMIDLLRALAEHLRGRDPNTVHSLHDRRGQGVQPRPMDGVAMDTTEGTRGASESVDSAGTGEAGDCPSHSPDFTSVWWYGKRYTFSKGNQAQAVGALWQAWEQGGQSLTQETIAEKCGSQAERFELRKVFRRRVNCRNGQKEYQQHPAWGTMIQGEGKGVYRLVPPPGRT